MFDDKKDCATSQSYVFSQRVVDIMFEDKCDFYVAVEKARAECPGCVLSICFQFPDGSIAIFDGNGFLVK